MAAFQTSESQHQVHSRGKMVTVNQAMHDSLNQQTVCWCPDPIDINPWLQIDLGFKVIVEGMMMLQGSDQGTSVDNEYQLEYSDDQSTWHTKNSTQVRNCNVHSEKVISAYYNQNCMFKYWFDYQ